MTLNVYESLLLDEGRRRGVGVANRPEVRNAFNKQRQAELADVWHSFHYDDEVRVVLTGEGPAFCMGVDRAEAVSDENNASMTAGKLPDYRRRGPTMIPGEMSHLRWRVLPARRGRVPSPPTTPPFSTRTSPTA